MKPPIYLDHMATTPLDPRVKEFMLDHLGTIQDGFFGNPASQHYYGYRAQGMIEKARAQVASLINCQPSEIIWTSGATESNNLAIRGVAEFYQRQGRHIVTSRIEHKSVLDTCRYLETQGFTVTYLKPDSNGLIDPQLFAESLRSDTILASIMQVNNELGVIQDLTKIGNIARQHGVILHVDGAQSAGKIPIDLQAMPIDLISLSAHKVYGPKGIGALYLRSRPPLQLAPQIHGGHQERGIRAGTLATHQIAGMGKAFELAQQELPTESLRLQNLRDRLWQALQSLGGVQLNGASAPRLPGVLNLSFADIDGELLFRAMHSIAVSSSSACNFLGDNLDTAESYVLRAIGVKEELLQASLRFSLGRFTTSEDIEQTIVQISEIVKQLRG